VLRYANVYGPRQDPHGEAGVVAIFTNLSLEGGALRINARARSGDSGCVRDYVYVGDVARANVLSLEGKLKEPVLNVGSGSGITTEDLARALLDLVKNPNAKLEYGPPRAGDLERSVLDASRARLALGDLLGLAEGLRRTVEHRRSPS
jgi:UDP-glucose 4-epimerase